jgi:hypothetical protein
VGGNLRASTDSVDMGSTYTDDTQSLSLITCKHSGCNSRPDLDRFYCDNSKSGESESRRGQFFVGSTIGLRGALKPNFTFSRACLPNNDVLALHAGGKGPGNSCVIYFSRPQCLTQEDQVLVVSGRSDCNEHSGKTHYNYELSQTGRSGHKRTIYLETEEEIDTKQDKKTDQEKDEKTTVVPAMIVQKEHLDLFEKDGWEDIKIKFFADSEDRPSVWVEENTLL